MKAVIEEWRHWLESATHPFQVITDHKNLEYMFLCGSVVEHCINSAKGCGFDSQGTHLLMKMYNLNVIVSWFG